MIQQANSPHTATSPSSPTAPDATRGGGYSRLTLGLAVVAVVLLGLNLRVAVASAAALFPALQELLGYGPLVAATLPAIPVVCFAFAGLATTWLMGRLGLERAMVLALLLLSAGLALRMVPTVDMLLAGTAVAMSGLAICNVAMPSFVRKYFPHRTAGMTGLYTITMSVGAALASGVSVPLALQLDSPVAALAVWALPSLAALAVLVPLAIGMRRRATPAARNRVSPWPLLGTRRGLLITGLFTTQALLVYSVVGWLPSILIDRGMDATKAGVLLGGVQLVSVAAIAVVMSLAARPGMLRVAFMIATAGSLLGFISLLLLPVELALVPMLLLGIGFSVFPLVMVAISRSGGSVEEASAMSTLAQSVGYLVAAVGPFGLGLLSSALRGWNVPLWLLVAVALLQVLLAYWLSAGGSARMIGRRQRIDTASGR